MTIELPHPVMVASGCGGTGPELAAFTDLAGLGGFVTRSVTVAPRPGGPQPRIQEAPSGLLHAVGLQNPGLDQFLALELPWLVQQGVRVFVSVVGGSPGEYAELGRRLGQAPGVAGIEVNLSAPDDDIVDAAEPHHAAAVVAAVRRTLPTGTPLLAKLSSDPTRVARFARTVLDEGADAVVVGNALPAVMADGRPAGLSGPAIRPLVSRCLAEAVAATPAGVVVACGGIATTDDARDALALGAVAVQVGTALLRDPTTAARVVTELAAPTTPRPEEETR